MAFDMAAYLQRLAEIESGNNPLAQNPNSSAQGTYQFIKPTAQQYGITAQLGTPEYAAQEQAAVQKFTQDNYNALSQALGREPTPAELYLAHQQGATGAANLLGNPDVLASSVVSPDAINLNAGNPNITSREFTDQWTEKFNSGFQNNEPQEVTDPELLAQLDAPEEVTDPAILSQLEEVTDPEVVAQLEGSNEAPYDRAAAGFLERVGEAGRNRFNQVQEIANQAGEGLIGDKEGALRIGLKTAQIVPDVAGEVLTSAFRSLPDFVENPIRQGASNVYSSVANSPLGALAGAASERYKDFAKENPVAAGRIGSVLDAGNLVAGFVPIGSSGTNAVRASQAVTTSTARAAAKGADLATRPIRPALGAEQKVLQDLGVRLTSGQRGGGVAKALEDKATSLPIVGDAIVAARQRGLEDFNRGVANEVLSSIGGTVPKKVSVGRDLVSNVYEQIGKSYDDVLDQMTGVLDNDFVNDWQSALQKSSVLPDEKAKQVQKIIDDAVRKNAPNGVASGRENKDIMRRLTTKASSYAKSLDPDQQMMGEIIGDVKNAYSAMLERNNSPELAKRLKDTDLAFAKYIRLEKASGATGNDLGVFTPAQLQSAVKMSDNSVRRGAFSRGDALLQNISDAGKAVLPSKYPDSGTAGRALAALAAGGTATLLTPAAIPALALGGLATAAYTRPGQAALRSLSDVIRK